MRFFHRTSPTVAAAILAEGFRDGTGTYLTTNTYTGVWISDQALDENEGAFGDTLLSIDIPEEVVSEFEWIEEGKGHREFLVPAEIVNRFGPPNVAIDDTR